MAKAFILVLLGMYGGMEHIPYTYSTYEACEKAGEKAESNAGRVEGFVCIEIEQKR